MKTKPIEQKIYLEKAEVLAFIIDNMCYGTNEDFVQVANLLRSEREEINYEPETNKFSYTVISHEIMTWEEEVEDMSYYEVLNKFQKLLLSKKPLNVPKLEIIGSFDAYIETYIRNIVKENEIE